MGRGVSRLTYECLRPRKGFALGRQCKRDLVQAHLCEIVLKHLVGEQFQDVLTTKIHITAEAKLLYDKFSPPIFWNIFYAEVKICCTAAKVKHSIGNFITHTLRLEPICLKCTDCIRRRLVCTVVYTKATHHLCIVEQGLGECLTQPSFKAHSYMFTYTLFISNRKRKNIVEVDITVHIVDVETKIVRIDLDRVKTARIERLRLRIRFDLLNVAAAIFEDW